MAAESVSPDGLADPAFHQWNVPGLPDANTVALIGRLDRAHPFLVGSHVTYPCPGDGALFLGINHVGLENNSGQLVATITRRTGREPFGNARSRPGRSGRARVLRIKERAVAPVTPFLGVVIRLRRRPRQLASKIVLDLVQILTVVTAEHHGPGIPVTAASTEILRRLDRGAVVWVDEVMEPSQLCG
jgi:hypothetical protein